MCGQPWSAWLLCAPAFSGAKQGKFFAVKGVFGSGADAIGQVATMRIIMPHYMKGKVP